MPLRADAERNRLRILDAALAVFAERGLSATMDEIAAAAGVGIGTVYRRYPDKERLIEALFHQRIEVLVRLAEEGLMNEDPWDGLVHFVERAAVATGDNRALRELMFSSGRGREWADRGRARIQPVIARLVERAQRQGVLRSDLATLDMPLIEFMLSSSIDFSAGVAPEAWRRVLRVVLDGLVPARAAPTPFDADPMTPEQFADALASHRPGRA
jgi:AcrR family transcriptional regulator